MGTLLLYIAFAGAIFALTAIAWYHIGDILDQRSSQSRMKHAFYAGFGMSMVFGYGPVLAFAAFIDPRADLIAQAILRATGALPSEAFKRCLEGDGLFGICLAMAAGALVGLVINESNYKSVHT